MFFLLQNDSRYNDSRRQPEKALVRKTKERKEGRKKEGRKGREMEVRQGGSNGGANMSEGKRDKANNDRRTQWGEEG